MQSAFWGRGSFPDVKQKITCVGRVVVGVLCAGNFARSQSRRFYRPTNVRLLREGRVFDSNYAANLSDDAAPALLENLPAMSFEQQCTVKYKIAQRFETAQTENDFRTWNWSRYAARNAMTRYSESLDTSNCPDYTKRGDRFLGEY